MWNNEDKRGHMTSMEEHQKKVEEVERYRHILDGQCHSFENEFLEQLNVHMALINSKVH
jgi:hypothetical protein